MHIVGLIFVDIASRYSSAVNTYNYELAKYLESILKPLVNHEFILKDIYDFVNKVSDLDVQVDPYMVSFDVESLFTNVPTQKTIELILKLVFSNDEENVLFHGLTRTALRRLLVICT